MQAAYKIKKKCFAVYLFFFFVSLQNLRNEILYFVEIYDFDGFTNIIFSDIWLIKFEEREKKNQQKLIHLKNLLNNFCLWMVWLVKLC